MKPTPQPNPEEYPQPGTFMVAVNSLTPALGLMCLQPEGGYPAGSIRPIYGGNLAENSIYTNGTTPKDWRLTVENGDFENEIRFTNLPDHIEEIVLDEAPGMYQLVLTDCKVIPMPEVATAEAPTCKVIPHPATLTRIERPASKRKPANPKQLFLFPETELQPTNLTA